MRTTRLLTRALGVAAAAIGAVVIAAPTSPLGRRTRRLGARLARDGRYVVASVPGLAYRLAGRAPDPDVADDILADRIRSTIGPLEHRLDVPRVHVLVENHVAVLHGDVPDEKSAHAIEHAVLHVSGVRGVESHLHPQLLSGDTRPSEGRHRHPRSAARQELVDAARGEGAHDPEAAVHSVLCNFAERVPESERAHLFAHLPDDVRTIATPRQHLGTTAPRLKTVSQLVAAVTRSGGVEPDHAESITRAVLNTLRRLVPEESADIAAVLPSELKELWTNESHHQQLT